MSSVTSKANRGLTVCNRHLENFQCASGQNLIDCPSYTSFWSRMTSVPDSASRKTPLNSGSLALYLEVKVMLWCIPITLQSDKWIPGLHRPRYSVSPDGVPVRRCNAIQNILTLYTTRLSSSLNGFYRHSPANAFIESTMMRSS